MLRHSEKLATLAVLMFVVAAQAQTPPSPNPKSGEGRAVSVPNSFLQGNDFRQLSEEQRRIYAAGIVDGMLLAPLFGAPSRNLVGLKISEILPTNRTEWLAKCVGGMSDEQVAAIITKYLNDHPERWHQGAHVLAYSALVQSCPKFSGSGSH